MKENMLPALKLTFWCVILFVFLYPLSILVIAKVIAPNSGNGEVVYVGNKVVGYKKVGQSFTEDKYFYGRPSAVGYNAAGSGASNLAPSNPQLEKDVAARIDTFLLHNPGVKREDIPIDLVTASGSGLDPDISVQAALVQVPRIARVSSMPEERIKALVMAHIQKPLLGFLGPEKINVLELNIAVEELK